MDLYQQISELVANRIPFALCTVISSRGSVPARAGAKMAVLADGRTYGTIGGAELELNAVNAAKEMIAGKKQPETKTFSLQYRKEGGLDLACGGDVTVFFEVVLPAPHVLVCGGGHIGLAISKIFDVLGYSYSICDSRPEFRSRGRFPNAAALLDALPELIDLDFIFIVSHSQEADYEILKAVFAKNWSKKILLIGSKSKWKDFTLRLKSESFDESRLAQVVCPAGIGISTASVPEIALSIAAWIVNTHREQK